MSHICNRWDSEEFGYNTRVIMADGSRKLVCNEINNFPVPSAVKSENCPRRNHEKPKINKSNSSGTRVSRLTNAIYIIRTMFVYNPIVIRDSVLIVFVKRQTRI